MKLGLIGPSFFSYIEELCKEINSKGVDCEYFDERHDNSVFAKICYRLGLTFLISKKKKHHFNGIKQKIAKCNITDVLLIDVEVIDRDFVQYLIGEGVRVHIYMWDSARNKPNFLKYLDLMDSASTFDPEDSKNLNMGYIPLYANSSFISNSQEEREDHVSFCGTLHSNRAAILYKLLKTAKSAGLKVNLFTFYHSRPLLLLMSLKSIYNAFFLRSVSTTSISSVEVARLMRNSRYVLDIQHSGQKGLTARSFEALRCGAGLITFNETVNLLPKSFESRVKLLGGIEELKSLSIGDLNALPSITPEQDYYLSIDRFLDEILDNLKKNH